MFEMIRLIFCRMLECENVECRARNQTFASSLVRKIYNIQIQMFLKYHLQQNALCLAYKI